jgi:glycosyltransferase involved in cell wall biosynthesis
MRIAYISYEYPPDSSNGGIATYVAQAARMMVRRGHDVEVFSSSQTRIGSIEASGIREHRIREADRVEFGIAAGHVFAARNAERPFDVLEGPDLNADARKAIELVPDIPLVLKMHTPTAIVTSLNVTSGFSARALRLNMEKNLRNIAAFLLKGRPLAPLSFALPEKQFARQLDRMESGHARRAAIVAPPCKDLCDFAMSAWQIPAQSIRLAPHPYTPTNDFLALRPDLSGHTVGFVGRLERRKGIETLVAAIPAVLEAVPEARFRLVGATDRHSSGISYDEWVRRQVPQHADRIEISGKWPLERMAEVYESLDVCVFPSLWENFPNVCLEAMSAGRAIVASSAGGMAEMLDQGRVGRLVPPGDPAILSREIIHLLRTPSERNRLGEIARQRVLDTYNEGVIGAMMERIYSEAIERTRATNQSRAQQSAGSSS